MNNNEWCAPGNSSRRRINRSISLAIASGILQLSPIAGASPDDQVFIFDGPETNNSEAIYIAQASDFDQNSTMDVALLDRGALSVLLGNGDGTFQEPQMIYPNQDEDLRTIALLDLNLDGFADILAGAYPSQVLVFMSQGDGTFADPVIHETGLGPFVIETGDVNGDGDLDVLTGNQGEDTVAILLGNSDGTLDPYSTINVGGRPEGLAIGDFTGEGIPDFAVCLQSQEILKLYIGRAGGLFRPPVEQYLKGGPSDVQFADLNQDGNDDLLVSNYRLDRLHVFYGRRDRSLVDSTDRTLGEHPVFVAVNDLNNDGLLDTIVSNQRSKNIAVLLGKKDHPIDVNTDLYEVGEQPRSSIQADFNSDGFIDILAVNHNSLTLLIGDGQGEFAAETPPEWQFYSPDSVAVGDINADGFPDIVVPETESGISAVSILFAQASGGFSSPIFLSTGSYPSNVILEDADQDKILDLILLGDHTRQIEFLKGRLDGTFFEPVVSETGFFSSFSLVLGDVDSDGVLDAVISGFQGVGVNLGNGDGTFQAAEVYSNGSRLEKAQLHDTNSDGHLDILLLRSGEHSEADGTIQIFLGDGHGSFLESDIYPAGLKPTDMAFGDLNEDSYPDIIMVNSGDGAIRVLFGSATGAFQGAFDVDLGFHPRRIVLGDLDLDGHQDLAITSGYDNVGILMGDGQGGLSRVQCYGVGGQPSPLAMSDLDLDGDLDLVVLNASAERGLSILLNKTDPTSCRVDLTEDGLVDFFDVSTFLDFFGADDPRADFTGDCIFDFFDISAFLDAFSAGCHEKEWANMSH